MEWNDLKTNPPTGNEYAVILFPCRSDCGILYTASNPHYAIKNGIAHGYTHWAEIELAPGHDKLVEWQDNLTREEIEEGLQAAQNVLSLLGNHDGVMDDELFDMLEEPHPHSTKEYASWMSNAWRLNDERNKLIENTEKAKSARAKHSRGVNPRVTELRGNNKVDKPL